MGIRDRRCVDAIAIGLMGMNCIDIILKNYKKKNEFRLNLKNRLLSKEGRETLETIEGADILRKVIKQRNLQKSITIERNKYKETLKGLNKYIQNADKPELCKFCAELSKEANLRAFNYKRN